MAQHHSIEWLNTTRIDISTAAAEQLKRKSLAAAQVAALQMAEVAAQDSRTSDKEGPLQFETEFNLLLQRAKEQRVRLGSSDGKGEPLMQHSCARVLLIVPLYVQAGTFPAASWTIGDRKQTTVWCAGSFPKKQRSAFSMSSPP